MIGIITQARVNSTRLPNKIFLEAAGKPFLLHHIERLNKLGLPIIVATTDDGSEGPIVNFCQMNRLPFYRGSESDVLARFYGCAVEFGLSTIIRVTSDCPLIDPEIVQKGVDLFNNLPDNRKSYVSNAIERTYPRGMDFEIMPFELLEEAFHNAQAPADREHVTPYVWKNRSGAVRLFHQTVEPDASNFRLTLDTAEDQELLTILIEKHEAQNLNCDQLVEVLRKNPKLAEINAAIEQKKV